VHPTDAEVSDAYPVWQRLGGQTLDHLDAKAIISQEDIADARNQHPLLHAPV